MLRAVPNCSQHVSTLTKQNFNLKLELHHRRERQNALEIRLEAAEKQIGEQKELQEVNEQLLAELEKRDQAVEEAVGIIVTLEERIERLMREREVVRNFDDRYDSGYFRHSQDEPSNSRSTLGQTKMGTSQTVVRMPSFLSEQSEGAEALRSLYLPSNHSYKDSDATLPKLQEEAQDEMNSPRLSALSESSFVSIYGEKNLSLDNKQEHEELPQRRLRKSSSVEKWIDERPVSTPPLTTRNDVRKNQYLSINHVIKSPLQRLETLKGSLEDSNGTAISTCLVERSSSTKEPRQSRDTLRRVFTDKKSFHHQQGLPPTPDTISTSTLRYFQANSNDTLAQDIRGGTFLNSSSTIPASDMAYTAHHREISIRPRSAGETVTSRREGHGWDTETQEDDFSSTASTFSAQHFSQPRRVMTPNLFSFADFGGDGFDGDWDNNAMSNSQLTGGGQGHSASRYAALRSNSMAERTRSDDATPRASRYSEIQYGTSPIDTSPRPEPPDRRSSLSAAIKLRKAREISNSTSAGQATVSSSPVSKQETKKGRLTSRLFGRSDIPSSLTATTPQQHSAPRSKAPGDKSQSYLEGGYEDDEVARATPPPIKRNRDSHLPRYRPSSAGAGLPSNPNTLRRASAFGGDVTGDEVNNKRRGSVGGVNEAEDTNGLGKSGPRKWLGFGRPGSMMRNR